MKISEIIRVLESFAAPELQETYDNSGLHTGQGSWDCTGALCTLDVTEQVIKEAIESHCNLVISHHPVIFKGLKKITGYHFTERVIIEAIKNDIALYSIHTNLDNVIKGVNGRMAEKLGLQDVKILSPKEGILRRLITFAPVDKAQTVREAVFKAGAGHIGKYSDCSFNTNGTGTFKAEEGADPFVGKIGELHEENETKIEIVSPFYLEAQVVNALVQHHPYEEVAYDIFTMNNIHYGIGSGLLGRLPGPMEANDFLQTVKSCFHTGVIRHSQALSSTISTVAICGGAGSFLIPKALQMKADAFITSDLKYHEFFEADGQILLADIGHYESEQYTTSLIHDILLEKFPTFAILKTRLNTNPVRYFY